MGEHDEETRDERSATARRIVAATGRRGRTRAVLEAGLAVGRALGATVHGLHVHDGATRADLEHLRALAADLGMDVDVRRGAVVDTILEVAAGDDVRLTVIAADGWEDDPTAARAVARGVMEQAQGPVLVVPRGCSPPPDGRLHRVLVPHDGTDDTAYAVDRVMAALRDAGLDVVLLHVLDPEHVPAFIDHVRWGVESWRHEFLARHADVEEDFVLGSGDTGAQVLEAIERRGADLVLVAWSQDLSDGRALLIHDLLEHATVPLLMVRADEAGAHPIAPNVVPVSADRGPNT